MRVPSKKIQEELKELKKMVRASREDFEKNYDRWHFFKKFTGITSISEEEASLNDDLKKPTLEFNTCEAYISRLEGEFSKQQPSFSVSAPDDAQNINSQQIEFIDGHLRYELSEANNDGFEVSIWKDTLGGGFAAIELWEEYKNPMSFQKRLRFGACHDATMVGWDPDAKKPHKGDGRYAFKIYPKLKEEVEEEYNITLEDLNYMRGIEGFDWSYKTDEKKVVVLCELYKKKKVFQKIVRLANNSVMTDGQYQDFLIEWDRRGFIEQPPAIVNQRSAETTVVCRYLFIENQILEYVETDFSCLPIVFADGNSVWCRVTKGARMTQTTRPLAYHLRDTQRLRNFSGQTLANELENIIQQKWKVPIEAIPPESKDIYTNPQSAAVLPYKQFDSKDRPLNSPEIIMRQPIPPEVTNTFSATEQMMQYSLGMYDAQLGNVNSNASGRAIVQTISAGNSTATPYINGFLQALNQIAQIYVDWIPKNYLYPETMAVLDEEGNKSYKKINQDNGVSMNYSPFALEVKVKAGANFAIQKQQTLEQIIATMQASPIFQQFINAKGLNIMVDNMEGRGIDQLKEKAAEFMQELQQQQRAQSQQPNPLQMKTELEQAKMQQQMQKIQADIMLRQGEMNLEQQKINNDKAKLISDAHASQSENTIQMIKAATEHENKRMDLAIKVADTHHRHAKETVEVHHMINQANKPQSQEMRP